MAEKHSLTQLPLIFILSSYLSDIELQDLEDAATGLGFESTYDPREADVIVTKLARSQKILFELRKKKLEGIEDASRAETGLSSTARDKTSAKRQRLDLDGAASSDISSPVEDDQLTLEQALKTARSGSTMIVSISWLLESSKKGSILPPIPYRITTVRTKSSSPPHTISARHSAVRHANSITFSPAPKAQPSQLAANLPLKKERIPLITQTTTEHDADLTASIPTQPSWVQNNITLSCQRRTPNNSPNLAFIKELLTIRTIRDLQDDQIGVRAYSSAIAAVAAYPYSLTSPEEVRSLPRCGQKYAGLFAEWKNYGTTSEAAALERDEKLRTCKLFYDTHCVGSKTAKEWYAKHGWRDLDDVVEFGWTKISREQQIGIKYHDEFQLKMTRGEVERIADVIVQRTKQVLGPQHADGVRMCIVGGYRRGNELCSDADVMISHVDDKIDEDSLKSLKTSLANDHPRYVTHELKSYFSSSHRDHAPPPFTAPGTRDKPSFDSLDKAFLVWQDPLYDQAIADAAHDGRNYNPHRRVDIIFAPWRKIGVAVMGWTSGTTFQRDVRVYARKKLGWKFDSSGIVDEATGQEVDLQGRCDDIDEAERRVFEGLGLEWIDPSDRCTF